MHEREMRRNHTLEPPIAIRTTGLSDQARKMFDSISKRAYEIFESKGRLSGRDLDNWLQAEAELFKPASCDLSESPDKLTINLEARGYDPNELEVDLEPKRVTVIGMHKGNGGRIPGSGVAAETQFGRLLRRLELPAVVDTGHVTARFNHGMLELEMMKASPAKGIEPKATPRGPFH